MLCLSNLFASRQYELNVDTGEKIYTRPLLDSTPVWIDLDIVQPDGVEVSIIKSVYREGYTEYVYKRNFAVMLDSLSGYWCYAKQGEDGWLESTGYPIHLHNPANIGIIFFERPTDERIEELIQRSRNEESQSKYFNAPWIKMPSIGDIQSLVIYIILADQNPTTSFNDNGFFNGNNSNSSSIQRYYYETSIQNLNLSAKHYA